MQLPSLPVDTDALMASWRVFRGKWLRGVFLAAVVGAVTGAGVALFAWVTESQIFDRILRLPTPAIVAAPIVGLGLTAACLHFVARDDDPITSDAYVRNFHQPGEGLRWRKAPGRLLASVATLGTGAAMGLEGPAIYLGAVVGSIVQRANRRLFRPEDVKLLMVAGAAAGVSAIFKAPLTGAVFAMEVPYQDDFASHGVVPAVVASASSYVVFALVNGTDALLSTPDVAGIDLLDVFGALAVGIVCGFGARWFTQAVLWAKHLRPKVPLWGRLLGGGAAIAVVTLLGLRATGLPVALGPGYRTIEFSAGQASAAIGVLAALFLLRAVSTVGAVAAGGAGGTFVPLVVEGSLLGRILGDVIHPSHAGVFALIGAAAFLGAGYRTPIAAIAFVAETTGSPSVIVPALLAAAIAQVCMGKVSMSSYQRFERDLSDPRFAASVVGLAHQVDDGEQDAAEAEQREPDAEEQADDTDHE